MVRTRGAQTQHILPCDQAPPRLSGPQNACPRRWLRAAAGGGPLSSTRSQGPHPPQRICCPLLLQYEDEHASCSVLLAK